MNQNPQSNKEAAPMESPAKLSSNVSGDLPLVSIDDFKRFDLRTAEILEAKPHPKADRLCLLRVRVGDKEKQIVAGIREFYPPEDLVGKTIIIVNNLEPAKLRGEVSEGMLLAVRTAENGLALLTTNRQAESGIRVS